MSNDGMKMLLERGKNPILINERDVPALRKGRDEVYKSM